MANNDYAAKPEQDYLEFMMGSGPLGRDSRHRIFEGFAESPEFTDNLKILSQWNLEHKKELSEDIEIA